MERLTSAIGVPWVLLVCVTGLLSLLQHRDVAAQTEIHRCEQPDGTVAFQGQPCEELPPARSPGDVASDEGKDDGPKDDEPTDDEPEPATPGTDDVFDSPFDAPAQPVARPQDETGPPSEERARCEKRTRDAIDAIDLEIRRESSADQRDQYLPRLRKLTEELRACKRL